MTNATLNELEAALNAAKSAFTKTEAVANDLIASAQQFQDWKNRSFHDSTDANKASPMQARQVASGTLLDVGPARLLPSQFLTSFRTWIDELHKVREIYSRLDSRDKERAHQIHPELLQDATILGAIPE